MNDEVQEQVHVLSTQPYIKVMRWMTKNLKLKGNDLTAFALLFERQVLEDDDARRINASYLFAALELDGASTFGVLSGLVKKGLVKPDFAGDGLLDSFKVDMESVVELVRAKRGADSGPDGSEPQNQID